MDTMFFQAAREGSNAWWQYLFGIIIVAIGYLVGQAPLGMVAILAASSQGDPGLLNDFAETMDFTVLGLDPNTGFFLALLMFLGALGGLWITIRFLHGRPFSSLINGFRRIRWGRFLWATGVWFALGLVAEFAAWMMHPEAYHWQFAMPDFLWLAVIALVLIPFQASFEELFVRGYLMQGIGLATHRPLVAMILTSILFASLHAMNPEIREFGLSSMMTYYVSIGFFLAILTVMDDGLELAMGVHTATNLFGSMVISFEGSALQTPALFRLDSPDVRLMMVTMLVTCAIFLYWASRRYAWPGWGQILTALSFPEPMKSLSDDDGPQV